MVDTNRYVDLCRGVPGTVTLAAAARRFQTSDMWIAALVLQHNLALHARDAHFDHLPQIARV